MNKIKIFDLKLPSDEIENIDSNFYMSSINFDVIHKTLNILASKYSSKERYFKISSFIEKNIIEKKSVVDFKILFRLGINIKGKFPENIEKIIFADNNYNLKTKNYCIINFIPSILNFKIDNRIYEYPDIFRLKINEILKNLNFKFYALNNFEKVKKFIDECNESLNENIKYISFLVLDFDNKLLKIIKIPFFFLKENNNDFLNDINDIVLSLFCGTFKDDLIAYFINSNNFLNNLSNIDDEHIIKNAYNIRKIIKKQKLLINDDILKLKKYYELIDQNFLKTKYNFKIDLFEFTDVFEIKNFYKISKRIFDFIIIGNNDFVNLDRNRILRRITKMILTKQKEINLFSDEREKNFYLDNIDYVSNNFILDVLKNEIFLKEFIDNEILKFSLNEKSLDTDEEDVLHVMSHSTRRNKLFLRIDTASNFYFFESKLFFNNKNTIETGEGIFMKKSNMKEYFLMFLNYIINQSFVKNIDKDILFYQKFYSCEKQKNETSLYDFYDDLKGKELTVIDICPFIFLYNFHHNLKIMRMDIVDNLFCIFLVDETKRLYIYIKRLCIDEKMLMKYDFYDKNDKFFNLKIGSKIYINTQKNGKRISSDKKLPKKFTNLIREKQITDSFDEVNVQFNIIYDIPFSII